MLQKINIKSSTTQKINDYILNSKLFQINDTIAVNYTAFDQ